jgi:hypothetical protein
MISPRRYGKTPLILDVQASVRKRGGRTGIANSVWCQSRQDVANNRRHLCTPRISVADRRSTQSFAE